MFAACSRSGTTIANDDSAINDKLNPAAATDRAVTEYSISEKALPAEVRTAFFRRYPDAQSRQWAIILSDGNYKADFFILKIKWTAIFEPNGVLVHEEHQ